MKTPLKSFKSTVAIALVAAVIAAPTFLFAANNDVNGQSVLEPEPIVGFWYIKLTADGNVPSPPDGTVIDWGLQQWHSDGTEILNSGSGPKRFCLGVWAKGAKPFTYVLNHFPLDYADGTTLNVINLREEVTLGKDRATMTGTFTFDVYDTGGSLLQHVAGTVAGRRITTGSPVHDVLPPTT
jgi:hypothetical protein